MPKRRGTRWSVNGERGLPDGTVEAVFLDAAGEHRDVFPRDEEPAAPGGGTGYGRGCRVLEQADLAMLSACFVAEFRRLAGQIREHPDFAAPGARGRRGLSTKRFPIA